MSLFDDPINSLARRCDEMLGAEMPTLDEAVGCVDCRAIRRKASDDGACVVCGSRSLFNVSEIINRETN